MMNVIRHYRALSPEAKAFLAIVNREVGLGAALAQLAEWAGLPSDLSTGEREQLKKIALARNFPYPQ